MKLNVAAIRFLNLFYGHTHLISSYNFYLASHTLAEHRCFCKESTTGMSVIFYVPSHIQHHRSKCWLSLPERESENETFVILINCSALASSFLILISCLLPKSLFGKVLPDFPSVVVSRRRFLISSAFIFH